MGILLVVVAAYVLFVLANGKVGICGGIGYVVGIPEKGLMFAPILIGPEAGTGNGGHSPALLAMAEDIPKSTPVWLEKLWPKKLPVAGFCIGAVVN